MIHTIPLLLRKLRTKLLALSFDFAAIPLAWFGAYWLRYNLHPFNNKLYGLTSAQALGILTLVQLSTYYYFRVYRGLWRFSSLDDVLRIIKAVVLASILAIPPLYLTALLITIPRSVLPLYALILTTMLCSGRVAMRIFWNNGRGVIDPEKQQRVLIVGAGQAGESLVRDLLRSRAYLPVGLVDDDKAKRGKEIHGIQVLGTIAAIPTLVKTNYVDLIFIAIPSARSATMRNIVNICETTGVVFRTLPSLSALASGIVDATTLRPVNIEDLLGRDEVNLEWDKIAANIAGKRVLVTGAGGSIGSELCRQILTQHPASLILLDNNEFNLYKIEQELTADKTPIHLALVNITDEIALTHIFQQYKPELVFHAAAYKHVPMLENQVRIAVMNNIIGTQNVAQAAVLAGVHKFILISSDKAVNPTNIMGTTKRIAEIYCQNLNRCVQTQFITVRFGNVLGSVGSVVPLFQKQLLAGGPLTVTDENIERYFMTIPEASRLILQAMANGEGGEIFVLDMGEPIKISYLAKQMIRLSGKELDRDISIEYIGLRPGEKLYEELFHPSEELAETAHEKLLKAKFRHYDWQDLTMTFSLIRTACNTYQEDELLILLKSLVPEAGIIYPEIKMSDLPFVN